MGYLPDEVVNSFRGAYNLGLFFRLETSPNSLNLWWGVADFPGQMSALDQSGIASAIDVSGTVYTGAGFMTQIPDELEMLVNGKADRVDWSMSGIPAALTAPLQAAAPSVVGLDVGFGIGALDERWQLKSSIVEMWAGTADFWSESQLVQSDPTKAKTRTIMLATMTGDASRALPYFSTWTNNVQQLISSSDRFCERVSRYYQGLIITWPRF